jgi:hypothetical protein
LKPARQERGEGGGDREREGRGDRERERGEARRAESREQRTEQRAESKVDILKKIAWVLRQFRQLEAVVAYMH